MAAVPTHLSGRWPSATEPSLPATLWTFLLAIASAPVRCPMCRAPETRVVDSRLAVDGAAVRRRRECQQCSQRFTTFERVDEVPLEVAKSDGSVVPFDRAKIVAGVLAASKGRSVTIEQIEALALDVEERSRLVGGAISSAMIGVAVLDRLRSLDEVAYLRFASVYKNFDAAADFHREIELLDKLGGAPTGRTS